MADEITNDSVDVTETDLDGQTPEQLEELLQKTLQADETEPDTQEPGDTEKEPETDTEDGEHDLAARIKELEAQQAKYEKRLKDKEAFIQNRNSEIGRLRQELRERKKAILDEEELSDEEILQDPKAAIKKALKLQKEKEKLDKDDQKLAIEEAAQQNRNVAMKLVPGLEDMRDDMVEVLKSDGVPEQLVEDFRENPASTLHASVLFQMAKRVAARKKIAELEAKISELQKRPEKITSNIDKFSKSKSPLSSAPASGKKSGSSKLKGLTEADIDKMSLEELTELQKELY